jgi:antitoxin component YwqK of YwqJK toxin-antitoxin module
MNIDIFDQILTDEEKDHIENCFRDNKFPWFLSVGYNHYTVDKSTYNKNSLKDRGESVLLTHTFYLDTFRNSENYLISDFIFNNFLQRTNTPFEQLFRSKANLQLKYDGNSTHTTPHIDSNDSHKVLIYYANDSDGDTFFFDSNLTIVEQITPKKGRFVLFDGSILHSGGFNKYSDLRINVNFNFI